MKSSRDHDGKAVLGQAGQQIAPWLFSLPAPVSVLLFFGSDDLSRTDHFGQFKFDVLVCFQIHC